MGRTPEHMMIEREEKIKNPCHSKFIGFFWRWSSQLWRVKSWRGNPVSIASLPMLYYDKYDKTLQAEGYVIENQKHGRAGYSLTKLDKIIRLIDRPHGQHVVILAKDDTKYIERFDNASHTVNNSRQIYLTFPTESTFTEEDVSKYFR